jgi:hypothetical protein
MHISYLEIRIHEPAMNIGTFNCHMAYPEIRIHELKPEVYTFVDWVQSIHFAENWHALTYDRQDALSATIFLVVSPNVSPASFNLLIRSS